MMKVHLSLALVCVLCVANFAAAAITITSTKNVAPEGGAVHDPYDPSVDTPGSGPMMTASLVDILTGLTEANGGISTTGNDNQEASAGVDVTTDGSLATVYNEPGSGGDPIDHAGYASVNTNDLITYSLGGAFDVTKVDVFAAWNDSGRDDFSFNLNVSGDGSSFTTIATYTKGADDTGAITVPIVNLHSIFDDGAANIASSIRFLQLEVTDADNGFAGLAEVDVEGIALEVPGDADGDGDADHDDFIIISDNFFNQVAMPGLVNSGDVTSDGVVDQRDFREWRNAIEGAGLSALATVPEPASIALVGICVSVGLGAMRRRS